MIVKDESHVILETLANLTAYFKFDYYAISDTGSSDDTKDKICTFFTNAGIPGEIHDDPWKDFGHNRTRAFEHAYKKTDYVLVWDADDSIVGDFKLPAQLTYDLYTFTFGSGTVYSRGQLFNNHKRWKYVGVLHEYVTCIDTVGPSFAVVGNYHFISGKTGNRSKNPNKYLDDAKILEKAFYEAYEANDGIYNRYAFYTAQSYKSCGQHEKAIEFYKKVLTLHGWVQEKYVSCFNIYDLYLALKREDEGVRYLIEGHSIDPRRIECTYRLVQYYCIRNKPDVAMSHYALVQQYYENEYITDSLANRLFVATTEYSFFLPYYMIIVCCRVKQTELAIKMYSILFTKAYLYPGEWWIHNLFHNIQFSIPKDNATFVDNMLSYVYRLREIGVRLKNDQYSILDRVIAPNRMAIGAPIVRPIQRSDHKNPRVMLSITTCKRLELFEQTMNALLRTWKDIDMIDYFYCVDDNSSDEDRAKMKEKFPFFNYYMKAQHEKGHRESMNIIWNKLNERKPTYWIHLEDDWLFLTSESYVTRGISLLDTYEKQNIHQLVFNREYGLMLQDMDRTSGKPLEKGVWLHTQDAVVGKNCAYWPHYSIQPSIMRTRAILEIGNYNSPNTFFERDYANKYCAAGFKTMFFDGIYSIHIGKQHWETEGKNAYALNETGQFNTRAETKRESTTSLNIHNTKSNHLVYFSVFYNKQYFKLAKLLLTSLRIFSTIQFDILLLTSPEFKKEAEELYTIVPIQIHYMPCTTIFHAACARLHIFEYPNIHQYQTILYLDTDILIKKDLSPLFTEPLADVLYGTESGTIESKHFGSQFFDFGTVDRNTTGLNSGTLLFHNCTAIRDLFARINAHIQEYTGVPPYALDQPFINFHAIRDKLYNNTFLNKHVSLYEDVTVVANYDTASICHFSFPIGNSDHKYARMEAFFKAELTKTEVTEPWTLGTYSWGHGQISFHTNRLVTTWGDGTYEYIRKNVVRATWRTWDHIVCFNEDRTCATSVRIGPLDFDVVTLRIQ